jgi:aryl-alcohol dehydrogenase-like predicted oxidoreductase
MKKRKLGRTGLKVSKLCLGAMTFGAPEWGCDEATSKEIVDRFLDAGGNFIDTADIYSAGVSEEITGRAIRDKRSQVVLATKVAGPMGPGSNDVGTSRKHVMDAVDASLSRLGTDYIDLYQVHGFDPTTPIDETLGALTDCVRAGKVRYIGCSNYAAWQLAKAGGLSRELGLARFDCIQPQYSLICRHIEREHIPLCIDEGIGVIPWSPLGGGVLTGKIRRNQVAPEDSRAARSAQMGAGLTDEIYDIVDAVVDVAEALGATASQVALAWTAAQPGVTSPIFGARTIEQLEDNLAAAELSIDEDSLNKLDEVSALPPIYPYTMLEQAAALLAAIDLES